MIDTAQFSNELKVVESRFLAEIFGLLPRLETLSIEQQLVLLREIDFMERLSKNGLNGVISKMGSAMAKRVNELKAEFTALGYQVTASSAPLGILAQADLDMFISQYEGYATGLRQALIQKTVAHTPNAVLSKQLAVMSVGTLSGRDATFLLQETFARFDAASKAQIFADDENTALWTYLGPLDNRTRDACSNVLSNAQNTTGWTIDEINSGLADSDVDFVSRGGFNCRHDWVLADEQPESVFGKKEES